MSDTIDTDQIQEIIRIAKEAGLAELEVESPSLKVRVRLGPPSPASTAPDSAGSVLALPAVQGEPSATASATVAVDASLNHLEPLIAPMVGTFYRSASPDVPPFVNEGDVVDEGQVVCMIEAMKLFNEIQAEKRGRIARILVENASPVEYGQPLLLLDPTATQG